MKKKIIVGIILIIFSFLISIYLHKVEAHTGELDPENYINLPSKIDISDGIGKGTIGLTPNAGEYKISYQKIDITEDIFNSIQFIKSELNDYMEEFNKILNEQEFNIDYQKKYDMTYEKIVELQNKLYSLVIKYTKSWKTTFNYANNVKLDFKGCQGTVYFLLCVKIENEINAYYDMSIYKSTIEEDETITISKTSANIKEDETLKLTATSSTNSEITWTSSNDSIATVSNEGLVKGIKKGTAIITAKGNENSAICTITVTSKATTDNQDKDDNNNDNNNNNDYDNGNNNDNDNDNGNNNNNNNDYNNEYNGEEWTDFSNAKFELKKDGTSNAIIEISNVTPKKESSYYLFITPNNTRPNVTSTNMDEIMLLSYDNERKKFFSYETSKLAQYVELNQDLYLTIIEKNFSIGSEKIVKYGKKLERYEEPKYSDAFFATYMTHDNTQLITKFTHAEQNDRKIQIKVGKVTDKSILQKIKKQDSSGFKELLSLAKSSEGIYNKNVTADKDYYAIAYKAGTLAENDEKSVISLNSLEDDAYYYLYIKTDDENGKYISQEAVTLGQAEIPTTDSWYLHFYGSSDFEWADFDLNNVAKDESLSKENLPKAGTETIIWIILCFILFGAISYKQYKKNNF